MRQHTVEIRDGKVAYTEDNRERIYTETQPSYLGFYHYNADELTREQALTELKSHIRLVCRKSILRLQAEIEELSDV